jgi:hypothetical protein
MGLHDLTSVVYKWDQGHEGIVAHIPSVTYESESLALNNDQT